MTTPEWQLSALALLDAHREGDYEAFRAIIDNTSAWELQNGLVQIADGLLLSVALAAGRTKAEITSAWRSALLAVACEPY